MKFSMFAFRRKASGFWERHRGKIKVWALIGAVVSVIYLCISLVLINIFSPTRAVIFGLVFVFFYEVFLRLIDKVSEYRKGREERELFKERKPEKKEPAKEPPKEETDTEEEESDKA
jgi:hypothetical protein